MRLPFEITRRRLVYAALAIVFALVIVRVLRPTPIDVDTAVAERGVLRVTLEEDGRTRAVDRYVVTSPVAGRLERIALVEGRRVAGGDVVARIEPLPLDATTRAQLEAQLAGADARRQASGAALAQARAARDQAAREFERRERLAAEGALSAEQVEQYALALRAREEELRSAEQATRAAAAEVEAVRGSLLAARADAAGRGTILVRAPSGGVVLRIRERSERIVAPGEPLLEISDPEALEIVVDVLSSDAVRITPGMPARLVGWGGPPLAATVRTVEPSAFTRVSALGVEEQRVNVILDLDSRPPELGDGFRIEASILLAAADDVLTVPTAALFRAPGGFSEQEVDLPPDAALGQGGWQLFVAANGRARLRDVMIGERDATRTHIISGVQPGEQVIVFPPDHLADGSAVRSR